MNNDSQIFVAGHNGMVGSAIIRKLKAANFNNILTIASKNLDLTNQSAVNNFFQSHSIDQVFLAAAKVGGIHANNEQPADFIYKNLMIQSNIIHASYSSSVKRLLFLGSSCIYPRDAFQPMAENVLLTGPLEPTNEPYAIAKIAGIKMCESFNRQFKTDYRSIMPTNLYGPHDNFHPTNSHVIPGLMYRFHKAKIEGLNSLDIWGSGSPLREFLHVDDLASAAVHIMNVTKERYLSVTKMQQSHINIGSGRDLAISELAKMIAKTVGYKGVINFDTSMPDGAPRKLMDSSLLNSLGWKQSVKLEDGLCETYLWYLKTL